MMHLSNRISYVTLLTSDSFLPGAIVLNHSLKRVGSEIGLLALTSSQLSENTLRELTRHKIDFKVVDPIRNPNKEPFASRICRRILKKPLGSQRFCDLYTKLRIWELAEYRDLYTKLRIWELTEYNKIVFLDSDMMVCGNIDHLFDRPDWSAVNAGGELPAYGDWKELNSGLLIIKPSKEVFSDMLRKVTILRSSDSADQGFLQSYFPEWQSVPELHLPHVYNMFVSFLDDYARLLGYSIYSKREKGPKAVRVLHFVGPRKPWEASVSWIIHQLFQEKPFLGRAFGLWLSCYFDALESLSDGS